MDENIIKQNKPNFKVRSRKRSIIIPSWLKFLLIILATTVILSLITIFLQINEINILKEKYLMLEGKLSNEEISFAENEGYVIVLGSYKEIEEAITAVKYLQPRFAEKIKLFFAVNNYYAVVMGIFENENIANSKLKETKKIVNDAYIFESQAFPYEIKLKLP